MICGLVISTRRYNHMWHPVWRLEYPNTEPDQARKVLEKGLTVAS